MSPLARLTITAFAVLAPGAVYGPAQVAHTVREAGHGLRIACEAHRSAAHAWRRLFPVAAEPPVLHNPAALLQRDTGATVGDNDDAIQSDAPAPLIAACGHGVPVLQSIGLLAGFRPLERQHQRADRRSPRGPPFR
ncbi:MAG: hypothetical protein ACM3SQ_10975 [Betaproteobacteria bacterium]